LIWFEFEIEFFFRLGRMGRKGKMSYPKEKMALENEQLMQKWLIQNEKKLPLTLYGICKELGWTFGATRGTILRIEKKKPSFLRKEEVIDPHNKRFKTKIALKDTLSEEKLISELITLQNYNEKSDYDFPEIKNAVIKYLTKCLDFEQKASQLIVQTNDVEALQNIMDLNFGLSKEEKAELENLIEELSD
jgi:hypothetical protein